MSSDIAAAGGSPGPPDLGSPASGSPAPGRWDALADRRVRLAVVVLVGWLVAYAVALGTTNGSAAGRIVVQSLLYLVPLAAAVPLTVAAARRATGRARVFWAAMAAYSVLWLAGETVWSVGEIIGDLPTGGGWLATALYLASYVPVAAGALFLGGRPHIADGRRGLFDLITGTLAVGYLGYATTIVPEVGLHAPALVFLDAGYPVIDSTVAIAALAVGLGARSLLPLPRLLVTAALLCAPFLDAVYSYLVDLDGHDGHWLDLGWQVQSCLLCLAAFLACRQVERDGPVRTLPSRWPAIAVVFAFAIVLFFIGARILRGDARPSDVLAAALVFLALFVRGVWSNSVLRKTAAGLDVARAEQERLAVTDGLTGLYNRRFFQEVLRLEGERSQRQGVPLSLIVVDLDRFKKVNDEHGHPAGDTVLVGAATRLRAAVRTGDVLARYGGEEFVVVLPATDAGAAREVAERCRGHLGGSPVALLADRSRSGRGELTVTASFGVATLWSIGTATVDDLVRAADRALYRAKAAGRDRVESAPAWDLLGVEDEPPAIAADPAETALLRAAELIDADQSPVEHSRAMARWAAVLVDSLGLDDRTRHRCVLGSRLHDIGKLAVDRSVLTKPGPLTAPERALLQTHPELGEALVLMSSGLAELGPAVRGHHERFDGTGYPDGLAGPAIPIEARVIAVCDAWAAMRADRVYAAARPVDQCRSELLAGRGRQFDPDITDTFLALERAGLVGELAPTGAPAEPFRGKPGARG